MPHIDGHYFLVGFLIGCVLIIIKTWWDTKKREREEQKAYDRLFDKLHRNFKY